MKTLDRGRRTTLYPRYSNVKTFDQLSLTKRELMLETIEKKNREKRWRLSRDMWWRRIPRACAYWISRRIGNIFEEDVASTMRNVFQYSIKRFDSAIRTLIDLYGPSSLHPPSPQPMNEQNWQSNLQTRKWRPHKLWHNLTTRKKPEFEV